MDFTVELDINRDEQFDHALSDITSICRDSFFLTSGWTKAGTLESNVAAHIGPVNSLQFVLRNEDGELAFENPSSDYYGLIHSGLMIRLTVSSGGNSHTFTFYTKKIRESVGQFGQQIVTLDCVCAMPRVQRSHYEPLVAQNVTTSDALITMMGKGEVLLPYTSTYFMIDYTLIDSDTQIFDPDTHVPLFTDIETGLSTIDYVGDVIHKSRNFLDQQKMQLFIADMCMAEAFGRWFYQPRDGKFHFHSRYHDKIQATSLTLDEDDYIAARSINTPVFNEARVHYSPRNIENPNTELFSSGSLPITIYDGQSKSISVRYKDLTLPNQPVAALTVIDPVPSSDVTVLNGAGTDVTVSVYKDADLSGAGGTLNFENNIGESAQITVLRVRGTPISYYEDEVATVRDGASMGAYDWQPLPDIRGSYLTNGELADSIAFFLVDKYKTMRRVFESITVHVTDDNFADVMAVTIGDTIEVAETWSGHDTEYTVIGEYHQYDMELLQYRITWYLRSNDTVSYFIIDTSLIDGTDILGY